MLAPANATRDGNEMTTSPDPTSPDRHSPATGSPATGSPATVIARPPQPGSTLRHNARAGRGRWLGLGLLLLPLVVFGRVRLAAAGDLPRASVNRVIEDDVEFVGWSDADLLLSGSHGGKTFWELSPEGQTLRSFPMPRDARTITSDPGIGETATLSIPAGLSPTGHPLLAVMHGTSLRVGSLADEFATATTFDLKTDLKQQLVEALPNAAAPQPRLMRFGRYPGFTGLALDADHPDGPRLVLPWVEHRVASGRGGMPCGAGGYAVVPLSKLAAANGEAFENATPREGTLQIFPVVSRYSLGDIAARPRLIENGRLLLVNDVPGEVSARVADDDRAAARLLVVETRSGETLARGEPARPVRIDDTTVALLRPLARVGQTERIHVLSLPRAQVQQQGEAVFSAGREWTLDDWLAGVSPPVEPSHISNLRFEGGALIVDEQKSVAARQTIPDRLAARVLVRSLRGAPTTAADPATAAAELWATTRSISGRQLGPLPLLGGLGGPSGVTSVTLSPNGRDLVQLRGGPYDHQTHRVLLHRLKR